MQQTTEKQKITLYIATYIWNQHKILYQNKLKVRAILLCDVIDHVIYTYFSVCEYTNLFMFSTEGAHKTNIFYK